MAKNIFSVLFIVVLVGGLTLDISFAGKVQAESSITKPSVPEFKLSYTNHVYDVPAAISQWSGEPIPNSAYHVDYREVIIKVKNQPHDEYINDDVKGRREQLYYNVRVKNHFSSDWTELRGQTLVRHGNGSVIPGTSYYGSSDSEVTYISISLNGPSNTIHTSTELAVGNEIDFQVKALLGYHDWVEYTFSGEESEWSNTQTLTIPASGSSSSSGSSSPSSTPDQTTEPAPSQTTEPAANDTSQALLLGVVIGTVVALVLVCVGLLIYFKKRRR